jgi:hypothetical protein
VAYRFVVDDSESGEKRLIEHLELQKARALDVPLADLSSTENLRFRFL